MRGLTIILILAALGCQREEVALFEDDPCGALALQDMIGAPVDEDALPTDRPVRVITPGMMVTMDYLEKRLNVHVDADGVVTEVKCG